MYSSTNGNSVLDAWCQTKLVLFRSNFSICAAEASTKLVFFKVSMIGVWGLFLRLDANSWQSFVATVV